ncbi:hypothetical protein MWU57_04855 [Isoptericola sp. S6320L]|uniref:hypothetical protein n=1 Tax=Isoptericola sp. S6320L TaxID=2926411 RepID=UPI001FF6C10B|nr:hypothetical protein [Isoptericola sp. S6320L]MCK0116356.1 hypothetical protein [Isoptericola sp. S6320L]
MTTDAAPARRDRPDVRRHRRRLVAVAAAILLAFWLGRTGTETASWTEGRAELVPTGSEEPRFVTFGDLETGHSVAGFSPDGITWIDAGGTWHHDGLPECVEQGSTVRYASVRIRLEGSSWRHAVAVDCRP